jgi:SAM-dependent methyltransferase
MRSFSRGSAEAVKSQESIAFRINRKLRIFRQGHLRCLPLALSLAKGKKGIEIGGPSEIFQGWRTLSRTYGLLKPLPIYDQVGALDNCNFSSKTLWSAHDPTYQFSSRKACGKTIIADGSDLAAVADHAYDFVLSSHNLEHFANPVKALMEWKRITRPGGSLILALPDYRRTFDHRRAPTPVEHILEDYSKNVGEDDVTHISEVLRLHDLDLDGGLKTHSIEELKARANENLSNRALHHHVFDESNSAQLLTEVGLKILAVELALPYHICILARWKE